MFKASGKDIDISESSLLLPVDVASMGKASEDDIGTKVVPIDVEASEETQSKGGWSRFWGTSALDVQERKYVRKLDWYLLYGLLSPKPEHRLANRTVLTLCLDTLSNLLIRRTSVRVSHGVSTEKR